MNWQTLDLQGTSNDNRRFEDLAFTDGRVVALHRKGYLLIIDPSSGSVDRFEIDAGDSRVKLRCLTFAPESRVGYLGLLRVDPACVAHRILKTTDGGQVWSACDPGVGPWHGICGIQALDENTVFAIGTWIDIGHRHEHTHDANVVVSRDGGQSWEVNFTEPNSMIDLHFADQIHGVIAGQDTDRIAAIWTTKNSGKKWTRAPLPGAIPTDSRVWKVTGSGFAVTATVTTSESKSVLLTTRDFRKSDSWQTIPVRMGDVGPQRLGGIAQANGTAWVGVDDSLLYESQDRSNWQPTRQPDGANLLDVNRIRKAPCGTLYAAGKTVYRYG